MKKLRKLTPKGLESQDACPKRKAHRSKFVDIFQYRLRPDSNFIHV